jgi:hypothetical protein
MISGMGRQEGLVGFHVFRTQLSILKDARVTSVHTVVLEVAGKDVSQERGKKRYTCVYLFVEIYFDILNTSRCQRWPRLVLAS